MKSGLINKMKSGLIDNEYATIIKSEIKIDFEELWSMRPTDNQYARIFGKSVKVPRKYAVYGKQYNFAGQENKSVPIPNILNSFSGYGNSLLINWYEDGNEYIGYHSDDTTNIEGLTYLFSYGSSRNFKFQCKMSKTVETLTLNNNSCLIMYNGCQERYKHALPKMKGVGRRISITCRTIKEEYNPHLYDEVLYNKKHKNLIELQTKHPNAIFIDQNKYCFDCDIKLKDDEKFYKYIKNPFTYLNDKFKICRKCNMKILV